MRDESSVDTVLSLPAPADQPRRPQEPGWPALAAIFTAPWLPSTTARRTVGVSARSAWLAHIVAALLTILLVSALNGLYPATGPLVLLAHLLSDFSRDPLEGTLVTSLVFLLIEASLALLALLVMPWGARDEPLRASYRHALCRTWLHSGHALPIVLVVGIMVVQFDQAHSAYYASARPFEFDRPTPVPPKMQVRDPEGLAAFQDAQARYAQALQEWNMAYQAALIEHKRLRPFLIRWGLMLIVEAATFAAAWILWALLRAVATDRDLPRVRRAPACEHCGYNLTGVGVGVRCSECGTPVDESLGPDRRAGTAWERRGVLGRLHAYRLTLRDTFTKPSQPGRDMEVLAFRHDHARLLALHLLIAACIGVVGVTAVFTWWFSTHKVGRGPTQGEIVFGVAPMLTGMGAGIMLGWIGLCTAVLAVELYLRVGRNLAHAALRVASHHSVVLIPWAVWAVLIGALLFAMVEALRVSPMPRWLGNVINADVAIFTVLIGGNLVPGLAYYFLIRRGTMAARFANR